MKLTFRRWTPWPALITTALVFCSPLFGRDTGDMLSKSRDLVRQVENPAAETPPTAAQRIDLLTQAITTAQQAPNHRLKGHRVLAIQAIRGAIAEIRAGDPNHQAAVYLHTADTELGASIELAGGAWAANANPPNTPPTANATSNENPTSETNTAPAPNSAPNANITSATNAAPAVPPVPLSSALSDGIMDAVENDHMDKVRELLQQNPGVVFSKDQYGDTLLHQAALGGHKDLAQWLLADKADVNARDNDGSTPLHDAAADGNSRDVAELLLTKGADVNARDNDGNTPLLGAATNGHKEIVELLLAHGADVDARDKDGCTPLIFAGSPQVAEVLLAHNADVNARTIPCGQTALHFAAMNGNEEVAEVLLAHHADLEARAKDGETPLDWAVENGRLEMVKFLLAKGADINARTNDGSTPLRLAEKNRNYDVAAYLRRHGAQEPPGLVITEKFPEAGDASTDPASLDAAARAGDLEKVKALLKADPHSLFDTQGGEYTPLVAAAATGHKDVVEFLLANHADINAKDSLGMTALCHAAQDGKMDMAKFLLADKADPNVVDNNGLTPLYYASQMDHGDMAELLLAHGADVNAKGKEGSPFSGDTALYLAACNGLADVAKVLLAHGANPSIKGHDGLTPLEIAIKNQHDLAQLPSIDVADLLRPPAPPPPAHPVFPLPPGVTTEMEQAFLAKYKKALQKQDTDTLLSLVANDPAMDPKAKKDFAGLALFGFALTVSNPDRTYSFVPVPPGPQTKPTQMDGKMYDAYLPAVIALKTTFGKPPPAKSSQDQGMAVGDATTPLCVQNHQLMLIGFKEIPGAVPPPPIDKSANFGIQPNLRKVDDSAKDPDAFTSLDQFLASLKQPSVAILGSVEGKYEYYAICRIAPNLCVYAGGDKAGENNYSFYIEATDSNQQELKGRQTWVRLVDIPTDNGQAPDVQGTVFEVPQNYSGPITVKAHYTPDTGKPLTLSRTVDWK